MSEKNQQFQATIQKFAGRLSGNTYLKSISNGLMSVLPAMIVGALATLFANINLEFYQAFIDNNGIKAVLTVISSMTLDAVALYAVFFIGFKLAESFGQDGSGSAGAGLASLMSFMVLTPVSLFDESRFIPLQYLGAQGLFVAIIVGIISARIYVYFISKGLTIKMPEGVPPTVSKTFANLTPSVVIIALFGIVGAVFSNTPFGNIHEFIYSIIQSPLQNLGGNYVSLIAVILIVHLLWFVGIHGMLVVMPIIMTVWLPLGVENLNAINSGMEPQNILHMGFWMTFVSVGGAGTSLGLTLLMSFLSKSKRYKTLGKLALPGTLFGINEPVIFGTPIILNPYMLVPFVLAPLLAGSTAYFLMSSGIIPLTNGVYAPVGTPILVNSIMQGGFVFAVVQLINIVISSIVYFPFFRKIDRDALRDEQQVPAE